MLQNWQLGNSFTIMAESKRFLTIQIDQKKKKVLHLTTYICVTELPFHIINYPLYT